MPHDASAASDPASSRANTPRLGIFTGRPWRQVTTPTAEALDSLRRELPLASPVSPRLLSILACRGQVAGIELERFFYPSLKHLSDPFLLLEMERAVSRLREAAKAGEKVAIHGDFDVDGITGCALLTELLRNYAPDGQRVRPQPAFIPDRARDGYGIAARMIEQWGRMDVRLLITVDSGSTAYAEIALARKLGMDVIILDHHIFQERPAAAAVVNPRRPDAACSSGDLCGVAVAFKLVQALRLQDPASLPPEFEASVLDLVALGLVADQMALVGENRILVRNGLDSMTDRTRVRPGLAALLTVAGLDGGFPITAADLAYQIAPRLNACGRIGRVSTALELLLTRDMVAARNLAREADETNQLRKQADAALKEEAVQMAAPFIERGDGGLVLASPEWHKGIIGIGAARLVEQYQVPTILFAIEGEEARGSARSVPDIDIKAILDECEALLIRHGGHAQAAGMTLHKRDLPAFHAAFLAALSATPQEGPVPESFELELPLQQMSLAEVADQVAELELLEPFGAGNPKPVFRCDGLCLSRPPQVLAGGVHLRFSFRAPDGSAVPGNNALGRDFVAFGCGEAWRRQLGEEPRAATELLQRHWDILFQLNRSTFRPRSGTYDPVQQLLVDIRPSVDS